MINGLYYSYINPGKFVLRDNCENTYEVTGYLKIIIDAIFHVGAFVFIYINYGMESIFNEKILSTALLLAIYAYIYYPPDIYLVPLHEGAIVFLFSIFSYIIISGIQQK
jgi:hypothetical protein